MYSSISIFLLSLLLTSLQATEDIYPETSLTSIVSNAQQIMLARFLAHDQNGIYVLVKDFQSPTDFTDTLFLNVMPVSLLSESIFEKAKPFDIKDAEEFLVFKAEYRRDNSITSGMLFYFIRYENRIYRIFSDRFDRGLYYAPISDTLSWAELLDRTIEIKKKADALYKLRNTPDRSTRNNALLAWLDHYFATYKPNCGLYDVCNWSRMPNQVINWIAESGDFEHAWKAADMYYKLDSINFDMDACRNPDSFGRYYGGGTTFQSRDGMTYLMKKFLDENMPNSDRHQALALLFNGVLGLYTSGNNTYETSCKVVDPDMRSELTEQLMPFLNRQEFNKETFYVIQNLITVPCRRSSGIQPPVQKLPELISIYQSLKYKASGFRELLAYFLFQYASREQLVHIKGNENGLFVILSNASYDSSKEKLHFNLHNLVKDSTINSIPKIRFEKIVEGRIDTVLVKEFHQFKLPLFLLGVRLELEVDVSDLPPGTWHFYVTGIAGGKPEHAWLSEASTLVRQ